VGLISDEAWTEYLAKQNRLEQMKGVLEKTRVTPEMIEKIQKPAEERSRPSLGQVNENVCARLDLSAATGQTLAQVLKRPELSIECLVPVLIELLPSFFRDRGTRNAGEFVPPLSSEVRNEIKSVETEVKYAGYLQQQQKAIERLKKAEQRTIPEWFDYRSVSGLSREMQETLVKVRPRTLAHASRIPGVTPAAVSLVNVFIEIQGKRRDQADRVVTR
jgi:tRNA uridine 5-carboxymethylaminomethyl modification enzyme